MMMYSMFMNTTWDVMSLLWNLSIVIFQMGNNISIYSD